MLTEEQNRTLTEIGAATPMGKLLRRYWMPIAGASELVDRPVKPIRLFGEDLVLYRDKSGGYGLVGRHCPHRRADLAFGMVEAAGIRCSYHGWLLHGDGTCGEQPFDDISGQNAPLREKVRATAYPVRELAGMLWAYLGPAPVPQLPVWEAFTWQNGFVEIVISEVPCNWFQCQENSCDPVHFEWMHENWNAYQTGKSGYAAKHLKLDFEEIPYGFVYKRLREGQTEATPTWTVGRVALWPNGFFLGDHFEWRVPIDDANTLSISWFFTRVPTDAEPYRQSAIPTWHSPIKGSDGEWLTSHIINQDIVAWVGQGAIADRTKEHLSATDRGITMMRRRYFDQIGKMEAGEPLKGLLFDAEAAKLVTLPVPDKEMHLKGLTLAAWRQHPHLAQRLQRFPWCAGQPDAVWEDFQSAIGVASQTVASQALGTQALGTQAVGSAPLGSPAGRAERTAPLGTTH